MAVRVFAGTGCDRDKTDPMRWVGTSDAAVYTLDPTVGTLKLLMAAPCTCNAMWGVPVDGAVYLTDGGDPDRSAGMAAYAVSAEGAAPGIAATGAFLATGNGPCHASFASEDRHLYVAEYESGKVSAYVVPEGGEAASKVREVGTGAVEGDLTSRQDAPHPHSATPVRYAGGRGVLVCDLGTDMVVLYSPGLQEVLAQRRLPKGTGPRHAAVSGGHCCVVGELDNTVTVLTLPGLEVVDSASTLPEGWTAEPPFPFYTKPSHAAGVAVLPVSAGTAKVFVTNRGHDSIAAFTIAADGRLAPPAFTESGGRLPWSIATHSDPASQTTTLLVANQFGPTLADDGNVAVFRYDSAADALTFASSAALRNALFVTVL
eukprot:TRINITY_DN23115_c0_g1_i1.p1 TRINITY_DN23115_c0_g1~~TRINITY_DN23115_c0_g1_i1.p1  ORF type:complete len:373 (+),score=91.84 TRINITY_DN23115_c0_g1_i1:58-1176(+)